MIHVFFGKEEAFNPHLNFLSTVHDCTFEKEELEVLKSIYPDSELKVVLQDGLVQEYKVSVTSGPLSASLRLFIGAGYPSTGRGRW